MLKNSFARVTFGSTEHVLPIMLVIVFGVFFIKFSQRKLNLKQQKIAINYLAWCICASVIGYHLYQISINNYNIKTDLPLYLCSFCAILIPLYTYKLHFWMYEILVFWVFAGTLQGIITPDIPEGFPAFDYFRYWIVHLGLVLIMCYTIAVFKVKPKLKSILKSFIALQFYAIITFGINFILNSNYNYLNKKPNVASALDYLGEWPLYLVSLEFIVLPLFSIIYFILKKV